MKKSIVAQINLGFAAVEGLMLPDGTYAVSVPQIAKLFSLDSVHAARDVKTLVKKNDSFSLSNEEEQKHGKRSQGKSFSLSNQEKQKHGKRSQRKDSSLFNQQELLALNTDSDVSYDVITQTQIEGQKHKVNVITLENFCKVIYELQKKGNVVADAFLRALILEGIERRFDKAFGTFVEEQERNVRIRLRMERILARTEWTNTLMERSVKLYGVKPTPEDYKKWTIYVNKQLFNQPHFQCNRDTMTENEQKIIKAFETTASFKAEKYPEATPDEIITMAINVFM